MTKNKTEETVTNRRDVLKMSAAGAVAAGTIAVAGTASANTELNTAGTGYRETEHVKTFYSLARF